MKNISLVISIFALFISIFSIFFKSNSSELVYVDINKLVDGYDRTVVEQKIFEEKVTKLQSNVDSLISNWQNELTLYEKERSSMTQKELALKQELLGNRQQQINKYQQAIQNQIQEEDQKASQTVLNDINDFVKEFGRINGYTIIFGATGNGNIMYANEGTDLTEEILKDLNKEYTGK